MNLFKQAVNQINYYSNQINQSYNQVVHSQGGDYLTQLIRGCTYPEEYLLKYTESNLSLKNLCANFCFFTPSIVLIKSSSVS